MPSHHKRPGRPPGTGHSLFSLAVLIVLRTGVSWRDLPSCFGNWHTVYTRFKHVRENGLFWSLLYRLQQRKKIKMDLVWIDSTTVSLHRHGSGVLKNKTLHWTGKKGLKHSRSMWLSFRGSFVHASISWMQPSFLFLLSLASTYPARSRWSPCTSLCHSAPAFQRRRRPGVLWELPLLEHSDVTGLLDLPGWDR